MFIFSGLYFSKYTFDDIKFNNKKKNIILSNKIINDILIISN